jgi:hypothetical protein
MRRRFTLNEATGEYRDRDGNVCPAVVISSGLGLLTSFVVDDARTTAPVGLGGSTSRTTTTDNGDRQESLATPGEKGEPDPLLGDLSQFGKLGGRTVDPKGLSAAIDEVWASYVIAMRPRNTTAGPEERKIINEALKVATVAECKGAIEGNRSSAYHQGENDRRRKYNSLSQILKAKQGRYTTRERIDFFLDLARTPPKGGFNPTGDRASIAQAKQDVLDGWQFPGDALVVSKGEEAAAWLAQQGWQIEREVGTMKPSFRLAD